MATIKESSTIQENKQLALKQCPVIYVMDKIGGYWKPSILFHLLKGSRRYSELRKAIPSVTEKMLIQTLKQLEADGLIIREAKPVVPPYVIYSLSVSGESLRPVLHAMATWGLEDIKKKERKTKRKLEEFPLAVN